jgi:superfamily II RNA helicase
MGIEALTLCLQNRPTPEDLPPHEQYILDVLLHCATGSTVGDKKNVVPTPAGVQPVKKGEKGEPMVVPVLLSTVESISHIRIFLPKDLRGIQARETAWRSVKEVERRFPDGIALLDPVQNMDIKDERFQELVKVRFSSSMTTKAEFLFRKSGPWRRSCSAQGCIRTHGCQSCTAHSLSSRRPATRSAS